MIYSVATMNILAIETSCDETSIAVLKCEGGFTNPSFRILVHELNSQASKHNEYGGVYPTLAKREHAKNLVPILKKVLKKSNLLDNSRESSNRFGYVQLVGEIEKILEREPTLLKLFLEYIPTINIPDIETIAVAQTWGLEPALWVGLNFAKALSIAWQKPLIPVNHLEGHIMSVLMESNKIEFPAIVLLVSGGDTELILTKDWMEYEILGQTRDDAVGEAFDKVARMLGLPYPGGPQIARLAQSARINADKAQIHADIVSLPRPMINSDDYDFSFSGLKTAVLYKIKKLGELDGETKQEIAKEFEDVVIDVLISKTKKAIMEYAPKSLIIGGGVVANKELRRRFKKLAEELNILLLLPSPELATDNAVMIAIAGYFRYKKSGGLEPEMVHGLRADGNLRL